MAIFTRKFKRKLKIFLWILLPILGVIGYAYFIEPNMLKTENQAFKLDCLKEDLAGKYVQISDLHFTGETKDGRIEQIYESIKNADPAAVFMTGDYVSEKEGLPAVEELVKKISAKYPVYAVFGNWDYSAFDFSVGQLRVEMEKAGAKVLINDAVALKDGKTEISLIGVKDPYTSGDTKRDMEKALGKISGGEKRCKILLAHSPDIIQTAKDAEIDLVLTGHTHGGQVYIPYITEEFVPIHADGKGFLKGLYKSGDTQMYVNRGIGLSMFPFRFLVPPEVTVMKLETSL